MLKITYRPLQATFIGGLYLFHTHDN